MRRKTTFLFSLLLTIALGVSAQTSEPRHEILLETDSGNVRIALYNETAPQGKLLGDTPEKYSVPAEIRFPQLFHKRGAVAAAREGDDVNPERRSSATQFYIVWGRQWDDASLDKLQQRIDQMTQGTVKLTPEIREVYKTLGGTPHLDGSYTVFGEVVEGLEVVGRIEKAATDEHDRPLKDIRVVRATVVK